MFGITSLLRYVYRYPTSEQKTKLAMEIIRTYPAIKDNTPGMKGYVC